MALLGGCLNRPAPAASVAATRQADTLTKSLAVNGFGIPIPNGGLFSLGTNGGLYNLGTNGGLYSLGTNGGLFYLSTNGGLYSLGTNGGLYSLGTNGGMWQLSTNGGMFSLSTNGGLWQLTSNGWGFVSLEGNAFQISDLTWNGVNWTTSDGLYVANDDVRYAISDTFALPIGVQVSGSPIQNQTVSEPYPWFHNNLNTTPASAAAGASSFGYYGSGWPTDLSASDVQARLNLVDGYFPVLFFAIDPRDPNQQKTIDTTFIARVLKTLAGAPVSPEDWWLFTTKIGQLAVDHIYQAALAAGQSKVDPWGVTVSGSMGLCPGALNGDIPRSCVMWLTAALAALQNTTFDHRWVDGRAPGKYPTVSSISEAAPNFTTQEAGWTVACRLPDPNTGLEVDSFPYCQVTVHVSGEDENNTSQAQIERPCAEQFTQPASLTWDCLATQSGHEITDVDYGPQYSSCDDEVSTADDGTWTDYLDHCDTKRGDDQDWGDGPPASDKQGTITLTTFVNTGEAAIPSGPGALCVQDTDCSSDGSYGCTTGPYNTTVTGNDGNYSLVTGACYKAGSLPAGAPCTASDGVQVGALCQSGICFGVYNDGSDSTDASSYDTATGSSYQDGQCAPADAMSVTGSTSEGDDSVAEDTF